MPDIIPPAPHDPDLDPFWVEQRAEFLAAKSTSADPSACGTCRGNVEAGESVEHDDCAQRATLLHAPDHPYYEILAGFSLEENAKLPARFHVPVFDDCGKPNLWLCAVCQDEGTVTAWPCATATKYGTQVFTPLHEAETTQKKQHTAVEELLAELAAVRAERDQAQARVAELERAAEEIRHLHKDSPMGPCPVCVDGDAMARGDDPTIPYPCPTARLAGATDCDPPSHRTVNPAEEATR